jgi:hypothetical protein
MQLKDFVSQALVDIVQGVADAQSKISLPGATINPHINTNSAEMTKLGLAWAGGVPAHFVHFDLAVTSTEGTGTKGGIGILAGAVNLGSTGQSKSENIVASRIEFTVPVTYPYPPRA